MSISLEECAKRTMIRKWSITIGSWLLFITMTAIACMCAASAIGCAGTTKTVTATAALPVCPPGTPGVKSAVECLGSDGAYSVAACAGKPVTLTSENVRLSK